MHQGWPGSQRLVEVLEYWHNTVVKKSKRWIYSVSWLASETLPPGSSTMRILCDFGHAGFAKLWSENVILFHRKEQSKQGGLPLLRSPLLLLCGEVWLGCVAKVPESPSVRHYSCISFAVGNGLCAGSGKRWICPNDVNYFFLRKKESSFHLTIMQLLLSY